MKFIVPLVLSLVATLIAVVAARLIARYDCGSTSRSCRAPRDPRRSVLIDRKDHVMKVLVTAASRHGSTAEIATIIAGILQASDIDAEVLPPEAVASVRGL